MNPASAAGRTGRRWAALEREARAVFPGLTCALTAGPGDATRLAREALGAGHRLVVAVGGDGTLNEVANGMLQADGSPAVPDAALGLLPSGTGGDFRRSAGIPEGWTAALRHLAAAAPRPLDVGRVRFRTHGGAEAVRHFVNVGSLGVTGSVDELVSASKWMGGVLGFLVGTLRALWGWQDCRVRLRVDGGPAEELSLSMLAAANGRFFGGGIQVAPEAAFDDGRFHATTWSGLTISSFLRAQDDLRSGAHRSWPGTRSFTAARLEVDSDARVLLDLDGEQPGRLPAVFEVLPGALRLRA